MNPTTLAEAAAGELAMDSAHIPCIAAIIERHYSPLTKEIEALRAREAELEKALKTVGSLTRQLIHRGQETNESSRICEIIYNETLSATSASALQRLQKFEQYKEVAKELAGQIIQAKNGFGIYNDSPSMNEALAKFTTLESSASNPDEI